MKRELPPARLALGISLSLFAYIFFVTASSLVWSFKNIFPTIQIVFMQNLIALFCILPIALRKGPKRLKTSLLPLHVLRDVTGVMSYFLYFVAIRFLNLTDATILNYTAPFFVPFIWWIWMKEKFDIHVWWSIIIGFIGIGVILNPTQTIFQEGFLFGLCAGLLSAVAFSALRVLNVNGEPMSRTLFYYFLCGAIISAPFALIYWVEPNQIQWIKMISVGLATVTAQMLLTIAYRYGTASYLSPLGYSTVVYAGISSWVFFGISMNLRSLLGIILIIVGGTLTYIMKKKPESFRETFEVPNPKEKPPF